MSFRVAIAWTVTLFAVSWAFVGGSNPAVAACVDARVVSSSVPGHYTFLYTPGHPFHGDGLPGAGSVTPFISGSFWSFGSGDPAYGVGVDNGYFLGTYPYGVNSWLMPNNSATHPAILGGSYGH